MKIICIGHAAYDITLPVLKYPVENKKIRIGDRKVECGGGPAANAAYLLSKWGIDTYFAGVIGKDYYGEKVLNEFNEIGVKTKYIEQDSNLNTTSSYIIANQENGSRTIITNRSDNLKFKRLNKIDESFDYILVDGEEFDIAYQTIINNKGKTISMIDAGKTTLETIKLAHLVDYLVCSNDFARDYTKMEINYNDLESIKKVYDKLKKDFKNNIIITLEKYGSFTKIDDEYTLVESIPVKAIDSTGAGDIYHGSLLYFLANGKTLLDSMRLANITSGLSVTKIGGRNSIPNLEEVLNYDK